MHDVRGAKAISTANLVSMKTGTKMGSIPIVRSVESLSILSLRWSRIDTQRGVELSRMFTNDRTARLRKRPVSADSTWWIFEGRSKEDRRKVIKWMERKLLYEPGFPHPHHEAFMLLTPEGRVEAGIVDAVPPVKEVQRGLF